MEFPNVDSAACAAEEWLRKNKTATLHYFKRSSLPADGYIEISISELEEHVHAWNEMDENDFDDIGFESTSLNDALKSIEDVGDEATVLNIKGLIERGLILTDRIYDKKGERRWIFLSNGRACLIRHSTDWDDLSRYYGRYMSPTRH